MAEKRKPTYDIAAVKAVFSTVERLNVTGSALKGAAALGYGRSEIVATIHKRSSEAIFISRRHHTSIIEFGRMSTMFPANRGFCTSNSRPMP